MYICPAAKSHSVFEKLIDPMSWCIRGQELHEASPLVFFIRLGILVDTIVLRLQWTGIL